MDCFAADVNFIHTFFSTIIYPVVVLALVAVVTWVRSCSIAENAENEEDEDQHRDDVVTQGWKVALLFLFIVYPSVSSTVLRMWHCRRIEYKWYLYADYRITCDGSWNAYATIAGVAFLVYPLGVPLGFLYLLRSNQEALHNESHPDFGRVSARFSFLYRSYEPQAWYWEVNRSGGVPGSMELADLLYVFCQLVMLMQKLLLTG